MFGRLTLEALPLYSAIAAGGAAVTVGGALLVAIVITWLGAWRYLWTDWLTSVDHKRIGVMYIVLALIMLLRGFVDAIMMRAQQAMALNSGGYLPPEHFDQIFSSHGTIMIFFMAMPFMTGLINIIVPLQIGTRDVAFPFLNSLSLWLTASGAGLVMLSLVIGKFSTAGWTGYPPYSGVEANPGVGVDYWIWAILISGFGSTFSGINFVVTILKRRAPGMSLMRMTPFVWTALCASVLMAFAFPALTVACGLLALDRTFGMHFFTNAHGGNMMNYPNLFWIWGHPEVYILILPAFGIFSEVVSTFSRKRLFGYESLVYATAAIAILSFTVWLHHFFTMGSSANVNAFFGITTMIIAVPTGVKVFNWLLTMYRGRIDFHPSMMWTIGFMVTFVIGGMTGVLLAIPSADFLMHNTTFLVAHFHNMIIPGVLFGYLAGYMYWFPKAFGFALDRKWGLASFWCWMIGFYLAFMPLYILGFKGMPRRMEQYNDPSWQPYLMVAAFGAFVVLLGIVSMVMQLYVSIRDAKKTVDVTGDPFDARTLEWSTSSPPPAYNFAVLPEVRDREAFLDMKERGVERQRPAAYEDIHMPKNSMVGVAMGAFAFVLGFAMIWHIWWLVAASGLAMWVAMIARSSDDDSEFKISAAEVKEIEDARFRALESQAGRRT
ncbi:MAG: cytochrome o ubiquinol oxidase subunit I [Rhodospirillaceae bacterium]|nr:cytochrome o ubiquinol oxidase subunit I [Rhodospirillaceae bacterium]